MNNIDKVVYINLDKRDTRREHIESVLKEHNITAQRFPAIEHSYGLYGCGLSHLAVLKMARDNSWNNVLILEDDIIFDTPSLDNNISQIFDSGLDFDVFMLDINLVKSEKGPEDWLTRVLFAHCAGAYIVQSHYYQKLIDLYEWALPLLLETKRHWVYCNDAVWGKLQETDKWYTFNPQICKQMGGYSDTKNRVV